MEFSFDRSNKSNQKLANSDNNDSSENLANQERSGSERLRKAIEKNRLRQAEGPLKTHAEERVHTNPTKESVISTRKTTAKQDDVEFTPTRRNAKKVVNQVSYATTAKKKSNPIDPTIISYLVKGCWIFCAVMVLRLIFASGGVVDFYSQGDLYNGRLKELEKFKNENMQLVLEIEKMQNDPIFQKKLVRDNLGFIANDEFLVLFQKEKVVL